MIDFLLLPQNQVFTVALALMAGIAVIELLGLLFGLGISQLVDQIIPDFDLDADVDLDADADLQADLSGGGTTLSQVLSWFNVGKVPVLVLLVLFLTAFGLAGLFVQRVVAGGIGIALPGIVAAVPALLVGVFTVRIGGKGIAHVMPKEETSAVSEKTFIGRTATLVLGDASKGNAAQAKLEDAFKQTHYILVEPDNADETLPEGTDVLIVRQEGTIFFAIKNTHPSLATEARSS